MKNPSIRTIPLALSLALSCGVALAQTTGSGSSGTGSSAPGGQTAPAAEAGTGARNAETRKDDKLARGDRKFMQEAAESGMYEVEAAKIAASKATDPAVKSYASMLVDQHSAANNELVQLANARKVELPAAPPRGQRGAGEKLGKLSGQELDQRFVREVGIKAHQQDIEKFEKASKDVKDPELKAWVDKTLPHLREHLAAAQKLPQSGVDASAMGNRGAGKAGGDMDSTPKGAATGTNSRNKTGS
jgi:putative membrane protein